MAMAADVVNSDSLIILISTMQCLQIYLRVRLIIKLRVIFKVGISEDDNHRDLNQIQNSRLDWTEYFKAE